MVGYGNWSCMPGMAECPSAFQAPRSWRHSGRLPGSMLLCSGRHYAWMKLSISCRARRQSSAVASEGFAVTMPEHRLQRAIRQFAATLRTAAADDAVLLQRFVGQGDEDAFACLLRARALAVAVRLQEEKTEAVMESTG